MTDDEKWLPGIVFKIEGLAGSSVDAEIIPSMVKLSKRLCCGVGANLNGIHTLVFPADDPAKVSANWHEAARTGGNFASADQPMKGPTQ